MDLVDLLLEEVPEFARYPVVRHEQSVVVPQADEVAVEEPMAGRGEDDAVLDDVRASVRDRPDVRCLYFGFASAVDDPHLPVCIDHRRAECGVSERSVHQHPSDASLLLFPRCSDQYLDALIDISSESGTGG